MTIFNQWWQIYCSLQPVIWLWRLSLCRAAFAFVLKLKVNTETKRTWKINSSEQAKKSTKCLTFGFYMYWMTRWRVIYTQKAYFYNNVLASTAKLHEFHCRRRLDDVLTTWCVPGRFAQENFTSGRHRRPISLSMLKVPNENVTIIVSLFSNPKNNSPQSAFYTASISNWIGLHQVLLAFLIMAQSIPSVPIPPSWAFVILSVPPVGNLWILTARSNLRKVLYTIKNLPLMWTERRLQLEVNNISYKTRE